MAKKKIQNHDENDGDGEKKQKASDLNMVVLKIDLHCEGCAGRVVKAVRTLDGVESVKVGDTELNKLTVIGDLDPVKLRRKIEEKTKKKVEVISPATKKTNDGDNTTQSGGGGNKKKQQNPPENDEKPPAKTAGKPKELPVTTGVLKVSLHCQGCIRQIHKFVTKTKGYLEMSVDKNKDLVTVKGAIDMKLLAEALQQKLKRTVEIVPAKKDGDGEKKGSGGGGGKKGKGGNGGGNGGDGEDSGGGGEKGKNKSGGGGGGGGGGGRPEIYRMENYGGPVGYPYPQYAYGPGFGEYVHAPQLFSDENPNACVIM